MIYDTGKETLYRVLAISPSAEDKEVVPLKMKSLRLLYMQLPLDRIRMA